MSGESKFTISSVPATFEAEVELANQFLATVPGDKPIANELAEDIKRRLDEGWSHHESLCAFSGLARVVEQRLDGDRELEMDFVETEAISKGLSVIRAGIHQKHWTTAYEFATDNQSSIGEAPRRTRYYLLTAAPHVITQPPTDGEPIAEQDELPDDARIRLSHFSDEFAGITASSNFLRQRVGSQREFIKNHLKLAEQDCEDFKMPVRDVPVQLEADRAYFFTYKDGNWQYVPLSLPEGLTGWSYGLTTPGLRHLSTGKAIRKPRQLVEPGGGFWLDIVPDSDDAASLKVRHDTHLFVPISGQLVSAQFGELTLPAMGS